MPFHSTLIVATADLIDAGPRIARSIPGSWEPVKEWTALLHDNSSPNHISPPADKDPVELLQLPNADTSLLLIGSPPSTHQATLLSQAIIEQAKQSNCRNVVIFAASNIAGTNKDQPLAITQHLAQALTAIVGNEIEFSSIASVRSTASANDTDSLLYV
ncbi:hypothetical protein DFQ26_002785 [Actinomortierella ambigua]|nr:hypothetical protein DFQ26_002785 [Actinomortierella ambigua]